MLILIPNRHLVSFFLNNNFKKLIYGKYNIYLTLARASSTNYNVIETDYDQFSIVYSCNNYGFMKSGKYILNFVH